MEKLKWETPLDYAVFQLSPKRSRCELFVSSDGSTEKIASGLLKPFVAHLKFAEEQIASATRSVKLEVGQCKHTSWFTKGTLERFVRFVSTPEVLEFVNTCDAEMSQLEAARRIYLQGSGNQVSDGGGTGVVAAEDATKKDLLRAIDVRLVAVQQDLSTACARARAAGFNIDSVSELQMFADKFGASRLNEACCSFISVCERQSDLISLGKTESDDDPPSAPPAVSYQYLQESVTCQQPSSSMITFPFSRKSSISWDSGDNPTDIIPQEEPEEETSTPDQTRPIQSNQPSRRLSVHDRINMFETREKDNYGEKPVVAKPVQLRRLSSGVSTLGVTVVEKAVLRRWSGASDMSIDLSTDQKNNESPLFTPLSAAVSQIKSSEKKNDAATSPDVVPGVKTISSFSQVGGGGLKNDSSTNTETSSGSMRLYSNQDSREKSDGRKNHVPGRTQFTNRFGSRENSEQMLKTNPSIENEDAMQFGDQMNVKGSQRSEELTGAQRQITGVKDQCSLTRVMPFRSKSGGPVEISGQREDSESKDQSVAQRYANTSQKTSRDSVMPEGGFKFYESFAARNKKNGCGSLSTQQDVRSDEEFKFKVMKKKESCASDTVSNGSVSTVEDSEPQRLMFKMQGMASENIKKAQFQRNESSSGGNIKTPILERFVAEARDGIDSCSTTPTEQTRRARQLKGNNHELNDELRMKANELEKLFAQHKLRIPGDQFICSRLVEPETNYMEPIPVFPPKSYDNHQPIEPSDDSEIMSHNYGDTTSKDFSMLSTSEGSRGKFYDRYMQKRNAKLREEWSSNRAEKEARLKSMQDSLERSRSEMKIKISRSAGRRDSVFGGKTNADRLRAYNSRSILKREELDL